MLAWSVSAAGHTLSRYAGQALELLACTPSIRYGSPSTSNPLTLTSVAGSTTATAHFALDSFALTLPVIGSGTTIAAPDQASYDYGSQVQLG